MDVTASYECPQCGESLCTAVDVSAGGTQEYVEDCHVCCRPNLLTVRFHKDCTATITAIPESD